MPKIQKVTDPAKMVTDPLVLKRLAEQGIDPDYVEFWHDYAPRSLGKEYSPYAKFYRDLKSNKKIMVVSGLPKVKPDGRKIEVGWMKQGNEYHAKANLFSAIVNGKQVQLTVLSDQPTGAKKNDRVTWQPQLFLNDIEQSCGKATLLETDPTNAHYHQDVLEWDYGICKRRIRIIEGRFEEKWIFDTNPNGEVRIKHNQQGDFKLKLGQFKINDDEELVPASYFNNPEGGYPVEIGATLTVYPDTNAAGVDGHARSDVFAGGSWDNVHDDPGDWGDDDADTLLASYLGSDATGWQYMYRAIAVIDVSDAPASAVATATTLSLYGESKTDGLSITPDLNVYLSAPANPTAVVAGDYNSLGASAYCDTAITYAGFNTGTPGTSNDFVFNADPGLLAVQAAMDGDTVLELGLRNANYDAADNPPGHGATQSSKLECFTTEKGTGYKPKLVVTYYILDPQLVTPSTLALTLTTYAPSIAIDLEVVPTTLALELTGYAPTVTATAHQLVTPTTLALSLTEYAPTVLTPRLVTPTTLALTLTPYIPGVYVYVFKELTQTLLDAQQASTRDQLVRVTLSKTDETDIVLEQDRILKVPSQDESSNSQVAEIVCNNSDGYFNTLDLKGWDALFEWGLVTSEGDEYARRPPLKVLSQYELSSQGVLVCQLSFIGIPDRLALDKASGDWLGHATDTKTVKDLIAEVADGTAVATELSDLQTTTDSWLKLNPQTFGDIEFTNVHGVGKRFGFVGTINKLAFKLKKNGSPSGTIVFRVRDADSEDVLASVNYAVSSVGTSGAWHTATLATPLVVDLPITFPGGVATGGLWIYCELTTGDDTNYISCAYNSFGVKGDEWLMVVGSVLGPTEFSNYDLASKIYYANDGIDVFSHDCEAYVVVYDSEDSIIDSYVPADAFKILEGTSRLDTINKLLAYTGCAKRIEVDGRIHIMTPTVSGSTYDSEYAHATTSHNFYSKSTREALVLPNKVTVHSFPTDDTIYTYSATSAASYALLPVEDFVRTTLTSSDPQAKGLAEARILQLERNAQRGSAYTMMNMGSEILDYVLVTDEWQDDSRAGSIGFVRRTYNVGQDRLAMQFSFGSAERKGVIGTKPSDLATIRPEAVLAGKASLTLDDLIPLLGLITDTIVLQQQDIDKLSALLGYGENEDTPDEKITTALIPYLRNLIEDKTPELGGNLQLRGYSLRDIVNGVAIVAGSKTVVITAGGDSHTFDTNGDLNMNTNKIIGLQAGSATGHAARYDELETVDGKVDTVDAKLDDTSVADVSGSRDTSDIYLNSSLKLLLVSMGAVWSTGGNRGSIQALIGSGSPPTTAVARDSGETGASDYASLTFLVPRGWYYRVTDAGDTPDSIDSWVEIELF